MKLKIGLLAMLVLLSTGLEAQNSTSSGKIKVAVVKPINKKSVDDFFLSMITNNLEEFISDSPNYDAFTREAVDNIMQEQKFQQSGVVSDASRKRIGELGGVDMLCVSEVSQIDMNGSTYMSINAKLVDVETGQIGEIKNVYFQLDMNKLQEEVRNLARKLTGTAGGSATANGGFSSNPSRTQGGNLSFTVKGTTFTMVYVEGGTFTMGCTAEQGGDCYDSEEPAHQVTLSDYYMGETEVTQALWEAVMGSNPSYFKGADRPVETVSWNDVQEFLRKLNQLTGKTFRLPTEAEWEYAARGGSKSNGYKYSGSNSIGEVAWYTVNCYDKGSSHPDYGTHPVKGKRANELGLYDMSGNVYEWCSDWYGSYSSSSLTDPPGPSSGSFRVSRGGSWYDIAGICRSTNRFNSTPFNRCINLGFRLSLSK